MKAYYGICGILILLFSFCEPPDRKEIPIYFSVVGSHVGEYLRLSVNDDVLYKKTSSTRFNSHLVGIHDTLIISVKNSQERIKVELEATFDEIVLIDTTFIEPLEGLEDFEIRISSPLPYEDAWKSRNIPREDYVKTYQRNVTFTRNESELIRRLLDPP